MYRNKVLDEMLIEADTNNSNKIHLEELLKEAHELTLIFSKSLRIPVPIKN